MNMEIVTEVEFEAALEKLADELPTCRKLLSLRSFEQWPAHLKLDAYRRLGIHPQIVYIRDTVG